MILLFLLLLTLPLYAAEIQLTRRGPYIEVARSVAFGSGGIGGINNTYVYSPLAVKSHACFTLVNNNSAGNAHTFDYEWRESPNPNRSSLSGQTAHWPQFYSKTAQSVAALATYTNCIATTQAAWVAITISATTVAGGNIDTADLYVLEHPDTTAVSLNLSTGGTGSTSGSVAGVAVLSQGGHLFNTRQVSAVNSSVTATITAAIGERARLYSVAARCSAGTSKFTINNGGTNLWDLQTAGITTATEFVDWVTPLTGSDNTAMTVVLDACGAGNTGTLMVQASRF